MRWLINRRTSAPFQNQASDVCKTYNVVLDVSMKKLRFFSPEISSVACGSALLKYIIMSIRINEVYFCFVFFNEI